jgi:hypothetical protein
MTDGPRQDRRRREAPRTMKRYRLDPRNENRRPAPPFWLLMLATMSRRHVDFIAAVRNAKRQGWRIPPRHQVMRAWFARRRMGSSPTHIL